MDEDKLSPFLDVSLMVEASIPGPRMRLRELLALRPGSVVVTTLPAGTDIQLRAGHRLIGRGDLGSARGKTIARLLQPGGED
jgi:flagellar motor switch/type III secretory pathway protein FliN